MLSHSPNDCVATAAFQERLAARASVENHTANNAQRRTENGDGRNSTDSRPDSPNAPHHAPVTHAPVAHAPVTLSALPYQPAHQVELLNLHAAVDALLYQLNASRQRSCDLARR